MTTVKPTLSDLSAAKNQFWLLKKTLYSLWYSAKYWYDKINGILQSMDHKKNIYNPRLYTGYIKDPDDPSDNPPLFLRTF